MRLISEDVVKLELDLKNQKLLKAENKILLKNILLRLLAGDFPAEYYEMSLVDIKLEMNRLKIESENRKFCPLLDGENQTFVSIISEKRQKIEDYETQLKKITTELRLEAGGTQDIIVVKSNSARLTKGEFIGGRQTGKTKKSHFDEQDRKFFSDIDKKLRGTHQHRQNTSGNVVCNDQLAEIQHKLLDSKRDFDILKENEIKRMIKKYSACKFICTKIFVTQGCLQK